MRLPALLLALATSLPLAAQEAALTLAEVLAEVRSRHPSLQAATATAAADRERVRQAGAWEDPTAGLELQRESSRRLSTYDQAELSYSQKIPLAGTRARRRALAAAEAGVSGAALDVRAFALGMEARDAFFQLLRTREQLALTRTTERLLAQAISLTRSRLATGSADVAALLAAETERVRLQERVLALEREAADAAATLNTLRARPAQAPVGELVAPPPANLPFASLEEAQAAALAHRPELREADARIAAAARARDLADRAWRPDPEVMVKARHLNTGSRVIEGYDTGVALSLPWFHDAKYRSAQREADRRREAAELDAAALRTRTAGEVRDRWQQAETSLRQVTLYRDRLLPLARQAAENARAGLVTGRTSLGDLVQAERALVDTQAALSTHQSDHQRHHALLGLLTGSPALP